MSGRSGRGRWERVLAARQQARGALGQDSNAGDQYAAPLKRKTPSAPSDTKLVGYSPGVLVLSIGEAAERLGMSRAQLEALIDRDVVRALPTGFTRMIPSSEVDRLLAG